MNTPVSTIQTFAPRRCAPDIDDDIEREFWQAAYLEAIRAGEAVAHRAETADRALMDFRQRRADGSAPT